MKRRLILWSVVGLIVAGAWVIYAWAAFPNTTGLGRSLLVEVTAPASLLGHEMPLKFYWFVLLNGAAYALVGWIVELARPRRLRTA